MTVMRAKRSGQSGFSLLEALVSLALFGVVLAAALGTYSQSRLLFTRSEIRTDVQQNARLAMGEMARQIRMAGYFPENFTATPPSPAITEPVLVATDGFLTVHGDVDGSDATNGFSFCLDGTVLRRTRDATNQLAAYTCSGGDILAENVTELRFTYYDATGNPLPDPPAAPYKLDNQDPEEIPDLSDTSERGSIRRVVITLTVEAPTPQGGVQIYHLTSDAWLRNG